MEEVADNAAAREIIEPEYVGGSDTDSGYDERTLSTASVTSTIFESLEENGRTYHSYKAERRYALPDDEKEKERMDSRFDDFVCRVDLISSSSLPFFEAGPF